jgi:archaetidylinositol phosphate synthase
MNNQKRDIRDHTRTLDTFTYSIEKRTLVWMAQRMPAWVKPDTLTAFGVFGAVIIFVAYALCNIHPAYLWLANLGFVINWFGDSLDGTVARVRNTQRPVYGFYIDHAMDAFVEIIIFLGVGVSPFVHFNIAALALIGYLLLSVLVYIRTAVEGEFTISYGKLGPTEARLIAMVANTLVFFVGNPQLRIYSATLSVYDWIVCGIIVLLAVITVTTTLQQLSKLAKMDPGR